MGEPRHEGIQGRAKLAKAIGRPGGPPCICQAYAVHVLLAVHAQVSAHGSSYMPWSMKAEAEEAAGMLQEASRSYIKAAALCKACGDAANQQILAGRARAVLGRLRT